MYMHMHIYLYMYNLHKKQSLHHKHKYTRKYNARTMRAHLYNQMNVSETNLQNIGEHHENNGNRMKLNIFRKLCI